MSFDDELSKRMKKAAEQAGAEADSAAAASNVAGAISAAGGGTSIGLVGVLAIVGLVVGAVFGATVFRRSADAAESADSADTTSMSFLEVAAYDCPDGNLVRGLHPGDRVFVIGENRSGDWSAFRDPDNTSRTLWLPDPALGRDSDRDLPVILCDEAATQTDNDVSDSSTTTSTDPSTSTTSLPESSTSSSTSSSTTSPATTTPGASSTAPGVTTPPPATTSGPNATTPPPTSPPVTPPPTTPPTSPPATPPPTVATTTTTTTQPPDTTKPNLSSAAASETWIFTSPCGGTATSSALSVVATDNVGVVSVQATYGSGLPGSPINMSRQGNTWSGTFGTFAAPGSSDLITITLTARDAAGNSASTALVIDLDWCFG